MSLFVVVYHPVKETNPKTSILRSPRLKTKVLYARKVKKRKFVLGIKKRRYFRSNWKPFQVAYVIGHEWDGITHVHVCRLVQSCNRSVSSLSLKNGSRETKWHKGVPPLYHRYQNPSRFFFLVKIRAFFFKPRWDDKNQIWIGKTKWILVVL